MIKKTVKNRKLFRLEPVSNRLLSSLLIIAGTFFIALGIIGIALPILPTTPFLLVAAACYAKGSSRFYNWLLKNRLLGKYIKNYLENKGISLKAKIIFIFLLWATISARALILNTNSFDKNHINYSSNYRNLPHYFN